MLICRLRGTQALATTPPRHKTMMQERKLAGFGYWKAFV